MTDIFPSVKDLLEAGAHFGHSIKRWNPKMEDYIYAERGGVHIFDLFKTKECLERACRYLEEEVAAGKTVLILGTKGQAVESIRESGEHLGVPYVATRWVGGTFTNWDQIKKSIDRLVEMRQKMATGGYDKYTKREKVVLRREMERLERMYSGLVGLAKVPEILFVIDPNREITAIKEAKEVGVTVVALADSNADPDNVDYIIPANDDALKSVKLVISTVMQSVERGLKKKSEGKKKTESGNGKVEEVKVKTKKKS